MKSILSLRRNTDYMFIRLKEINKKLEDTNEKSLDIIEFDLIY
jgi:hypothetical protein